MFRWSMSPGVVPTRAPSRNIAVLSRAPDRTTWCQVLSVTSLVLVTGSPGLLNLPRSLLSVPTYRAGTTLYGSSPMARFW